MFSATSIRLPQTGWTPVADSLGTWRNSAGDTLSAHYFPMPPDFPAPLRDLGAIRDAYRRLLGKRGAIVEIELDQIQGCAALRAIFKLRQQPNGIMYMAVVMIPFRDHNFMVKVTCQGTEVAVCREAEVAKRLGTPVTHGCDDGNDAGAIVRDPSDDAEWDTLFPEYPLSRARAHLQNMLLKTELPDAVRSVAPFVGPDEPKAWERPKDDLE